MFFVGEGGVLMGTARLAKEAEQSSDQQRRTQEIRRLELALAEKARAHEAHSLAIEAAYEAEQFQLQQDLANLREQEKARGQCRAAQAQSRFADNMEN